MIMTLLLAACEGTPPPVPTTQPPTAAPEDAPEDTPPSEEDDACRNEAQITEDPPLPTGDEVVPGTTVEKSWTLTNTGTCTWGEGYTFTQIGGGLLLATPSEQPLPEVAPGEQVTVTAQLEMSTEAPAGVEQEAVFQLRDPQGSGFGPTPFVLATPAEEDIDIATPTPRDG
jgi:hypothetical protein